MAHRLDLSCTQGLCWPPRPGPEAVGSITVFLCLPPEDEQREKSVSHQTVQQLVLEKEQALADLNSVEKSLADLFRRYEKMKEVLEGFRKVCWCLRGGRARPAWWGRRRGLGGSWRRFGGPSSPDGWVGHGGHGLHPHPYPSGSPAFLGFSSVGLTPMLYHQNEEVLKKCAQEYLSRVKKEDQRYQALKVHAEEKLDR